MKGSRPLAANHERVLRVLRTARTPMTAYEVLDSVRPRGISAPPTVYRALNRLVEEGLVHRLESINSYMACASHHHGHGIAIFAICQDCGQVEEFAEGTLLRRLKATVLQKGFVADETVVEVKGHCAACVENAVNA
jgi:Fur family transcriptional regulator, zinc uptake regulator